MCVRKLTKSRLSVTHQWVGGVFKFFNLRWVGLSLIADNGPTDNSDTVWCLTCSYTSGTTIVIHTWCLVEFLTHRARPGPAVMSTTSHLLTSRSCHSGCTRQRRWHDQLILAILTSLILQINNTEGNKLIA